MITAIPEALARLRFAKPFSPFELVFKDGRRVSVTAPESVGWHGKSDRLSYAADDDTFVHARLSDVSAVQPSQSNGNGAGV
jgi:hypothetical protein